MAKARQHRPRASAVAAPVDRDPHPRQPTRVQRPGANTRAGSRERTGWSRWTPQLAVAAAVVAVGLVAWWVFASAQGDGGAGNGARPVANLAAPDVHSLLVHPGNPDHVLFGSHAGIQESRDGGFTWKPGGLRNADAMSLAASPKDATTLYAAGHDVFQVSRDGGRTWRPVEHDLPGTDLHAFAQDLTDPRRLYALVAGRGIFASEDSGATWTLLPTQPPGGGMHMALASSGEHLYAATGSGLLVSRDRGSSWEPLPAQPGGGVMSLAIPAAAPQTLYAGTEDGLARSTDGGASWTALGPEGVPALALAAAPSDPNRVLFVSENGAVYRSDDGGASWLAPR